MPIPTCRHLICAASKGAHCRISDDRLGMRAGDPPARTPSPETVAEIDDLLAKLDRDELLAEVRRREMLDAAERLAEIIRAERREERDLVLAAMDDSSEAETRHARIAALCKVL